MITVISPKNPNCRAIVDVVGGVVRVEFWDRAYASHVFRRGEAGIFALPLHYVLNVVHAVLAEVAEGAQGGRAASLRGFERSR